jgi:thiamine pyrophosphate-dependent acetolactate synthase large subunit-like protein
VLTDLKTGAAFPSGHPLAGAAPGTFLTAAGRALVRAADVVVALDWIDLGGTLRQAYGDDTVGATIVSCTLDAGGMFELAPVDVSIAAHPDALVDALDARLGDRATREGWPAPGAGADEGEPQDGGIPMRALAAALNDALTGGDACLVRLPLGWDGRDLHVAGPLDYLGQDGGAGLGSGPGMAVGAALALRGSGRLPVAVLGDGDLLMGATALWTAAHESLPLLVVVANNRSFFNDEVHQQRVAIARGRAVENRWIGQHIRDPDPDLATLARALGLEGYGPVEDEAELAGVLERAAGAARSGAAVLVDVRVGTSGYPGGVKAR